MRELLLADLARATSSRAVASCVAAAVHLAPYFDYVTHVNGEPLNAETRTLGAAITQFDGKPVPLRIYNSKMCSTRGALRVPTTRHEEYDR